jgi:hypothetical protein
MLYLFLFDILSGILCSLRFDLFINSLLSNTIIFVLFLKIFFLNVLMMNLGNYFVVYIYCYYYNIILSLDLIKELKKICHNSDNTNYYTLTIYEKIIKIPFTLIYVNILYAIIFINFGIMSNVLKILLLPLYHSIYLYEIKWKNNDANLVISKLLTFENRWGFFYGYGLIISFVTIDIFYYNIYINILTIITFMSKNNLGEKKYMTLPTTLLLMLVERILGVIRYCLINMYRNTNYNLSKAKSNKQ